MHLKEWFFITLIFFVLVNSSLQRKSKIKCEEYAQYVYQIEDSPVMSRRASQDKVNTCGMVEVPLVIGGVKAKPKEFPHMAVIAYGSSPNDPNLKWMCGGTLISDIYVLTAAHCINDQANKPQKIRLGEVNFLEDKESETQDRLIEETIKHPDYDGGKYHDLALLKMDSPVKFTAYVRPACLHTNRNLPPNLIATGFGKTSYAAQEGSQYLMKVTLNVFEKDYCQKKFESEIKRGILKDGITDQITCAGHVAGGKDTCQGDSGGPLQMALKSPYCMYGIAGVVSFGKFCGFADSPAIYTTVSQYLDWIEDIVWP